MITISGMFPVLVVAELPAQKDFYEKHFGFQSQYFDPDFYVHLMHPDSGTQLGFMVPNHPSQPDFLHPPVASAGMVISFEVPDATEAFAAARSSGLKVVFDLKVEAFGLTHFMVEDPAGLVVDVVEHHVQASSV